MSSPVEALLLVALVVTSGFVLMMYRKLKRLDAYHADYQRILAETAVALDSARDAVASLNGDGRHLALVLGSRIEEATRVMAEIDMKLARAARAVANMDGAATPGQTASTHR